MDGKGRWIDNVFIERLWRSVKYEEVYLRAYANGTEARASLKIYFRFYNERRLHENLNYATPDEVYFGRARRFDAGGRVKGMTDNSVATPISGDTRGSGCLEISAPGAFTAVGFFRPKKKSGASAAERGRLRLFKTIDEDRR